MNDSKTATVADLAPALALLSKASDLPAPWSMTIYPPKGIDASSVSIALRTGAEVQAWAEFLGSEFVRSEHKGGTHYSTYTFAPCHVSVSAIIDGIDGEVSA